MWRPARSSALAAVAVACAAVVDASSTYQTLIPNGANVACPPGQMGCVAGQYAVTLTCPGVGHHTCVGGTFPNNQFGLDFAAAAHQWTRTLCMADSDGDGLTNGEELGDPCCVWTPASTANISGYITSHPGFATSVSASPVRASTCGAAPPLAVTAPPSAAQFFNPGEVQLNFTITNPGMVLTNATTNYWMFSVPLPTDRIYQLTGFSILLDQVLVVHHFVLYGCPYPAPATTVVSGPYAYSTPALCAETPLYAWAPGSGYFATPSSTGILFGTTQNVQSIVMQVHYSQSMGGTAAWAPVVDRSTLIAFYTPTLRPHNLGMIQSGSVINVQPIPPNQPAWFDQSACTLSGLAPTGVTVTNYLLHAHLLGRAIWTDRLLLSGAAGVSGGGSLAFEAPWSFNNQQLAYAAPNTVLNNGDTLSTVCVYNSSGAVDYTYGGFATTNEMCVQFTYVWPYYGTERCSTVIAKAGLLPPGATTSIAVLSGPVAPGSLATEGVLTASLSPVCAAELAAAGGAAMASCFTSPWVYATDSLGNIALSSTAAASGTSIYCPLVLGVMSASVGAARTYGPLLLLGVASSSSMPVGGANATLGADGLSISGATLVAPGTGCSISFSAAAAGAAPAVVQTAGAMNVLYTYTSNLSSAASDPPCAASACDTAGYYSVTTGNLEATVFMSRAPPSAGCRSLVAYVPPNSSVGYLFYSITTAAVGTTSVLEQLSNTPNPWAIAVASTASGAIAVDIPSSSVVTAVGSAPTTPICRVVLQYTPGVPLTIAPAPPEAAPAPAHVSAAAPHRGAVAALLAVTALVSCMFS